MSDDFKRGYNAAKRHYGLAPLQRLQAINRETQALREAAEFRLPNGLPWWLTKPLDRITQLAQEDKGN